MSELESIERLRQRVLATSNLEITEIFRSSVFVGIVDAQRQLLLVQYKTKLFLIKYASVAQSIAYQLFLKKFGQMIAIHFSPAPGIADLVQLALQSLSEQSSKSMDQARVNSTAS